MTAKADAQGITAINNMPGMEGIDFETMTPKPTVDGLSFFTGYSGPAIKPIGPRGIGLPGTSGGEDREGGKK